MPISKEQDFASAPPELLDRLRELEEEVAARREEHEQLARAVKGSTEGLWEWVVGTDTVHHGERLAELLGFGPEDKFQFSREEFRRRLHPDDLAQTLEAMDRHLEGKAPYDVEYRLRCKDGNFRWFRSRGAAIRDEEGRPTRVAGGLTDITERVEVHERLIEARQQAEEAIERLSAFFQLSLDLLCIADTDGFFRRVNPAYTETLGYSEEELLEKPFMSFVHPEDHEATSEAVSDLASGEEVTHFVNRYRHKDGHYVWLEWSSAAAPSGVIYAVARDITRRRAKEEELRQAKLAAEAASRAKSEFLANMSHEVRTPMNAIIGMSELLLDTKLTPRQEEYQRLVLESADALLGIMNDVLDFSKIEAGKLELDPNEFDLRESMDDTLRALDVRAKEKGLDLNCDTEDDLPRLIYADEGRLRQVVINLVGNAIKFTEEGEVGVHIGLDAGEDGETYLRIRVSDTGVGIPSDKMDAIFEPFTQAEGSTARRFGGTGLGLSICRTLAALMGGKIEVESKEGEGSCFTFIARCEVRRETAQEVSDATTLPRKASSIAEKPDEVPTLHVLLAEDGRANQLVATRFLERRGHQVTLAENGREAVEHFEGGDFDAILMDVHMPKLNGFEATQQIRAMERDRNSKIPIIAMTANAMEGDREKCLAAGMDGYLAKPVHAGELYAVLEDLTSRSR